MGFTPLVYPQATHTRYVHLLGTAKSGYLMCDAMGKNGPEFIMDDSFQRAIASAGMIHDVGHSPYSHDLHNIFNHYSGLTHEEIASQIVLGEYSFEESIRELPEIIMPKHSKEVFLKICSELDSVPVVLKKYGIDKDIVAQIISASRGDIPDSIGKNKFLRECIDSRIIDADKLDYYERDSRIANVSQTYFSANSIIPRLGIVKDSKKDYHLAIDEGIIEHINHMISVRKYDYNQIYTHKKAEINRAMTYEACKRFFKSMNDFSEKGIDIKTISRSFHLLDDMQFFSLLTSYSKDDFATRLYAVARYNLTLKYDIAYSIDSNKIPDFGSENISENSLLLKNVYKLYNDIKSNGIQYPEDVIKERILQRLNSSMSKKLDEKDFFVFFPAKTVIPTKEDLLNRFNLYVFNKKGDSYHIKDALSTQNRHYNESAQRAFNTFCRHETSSYFFIMVSHGNKDSVTSQKLENVLKDIVKDD